MLEDVAEPAGFRIDFLNQRSNRHKTPHAHYTAAILQDSEESWRRARAIRGAPVPALLVSERYRPVRTARTGALQIRSQVIAPYNAREIMLHLGSLHERRRYLTCLGGGTGLYVLLSGLKHLTRVHLTSVVNMSDDGGSSGRLRLAFGILPPGDVRRSLVALSDAPEFLSELMQYRFSRGGRALRGHNMGNLLLTALTDIQGSMPEAVRSASALLNIRGIVLPVTDDPAHLVARFEDGSVVKGEAAIDVPRARDPNLHVMRLWHEPAAHAHPDALAALDHADVILIGPGDLYSSVATNLIVKGIGEAIRRSPAVKIYIANLMTKPGETAYYSVEDHVAEIVKYLKEDVLDYIIASDSSPPQKILRAYAKQGQYLVTIRSPKALRAISKAKLIVHNLAQSGLPVRHDPRKLSDLIAPLIPR